MMFMKCLYALILLLLWTPPSFAAVLFEENEVIEARLTGPLDSVFEDSEQREEQLFQINVGGTDIPVKVRMRGKSRARICAFPPLRLNFTGSDTGNTVFAGQEKLKLVTHCRNGDGGDTSLLEEYATYRIFSLLSDNSFRVRLLHISYEDSGANVKQQYGFVIEPAKQLLARTGGEWAKLPGVRLSRLDDKQEALVYVFQYLIGNTDWSLVTAEGSETCCHNVDLLELDSELYPVPYDFDLSGLVKAAYAKPDASLHIKSVRQRRYRGYCMDNEALAGAVRWIQSKQAEILQVFEELPDYPDKAKTDNVKYLKQFFDMAENEPKLIKSFAKYCLE
ncbi:hypothetical protein ACFL00_05555 [Pseudomonadota bacterium]